MTQSNTPPWMFSRFLNCTNVTKSRNASGCFFGFVLFYASIQIWRENNQPWKQLNVNYTVFQRCNLPFWCWRHLKHLLDKYWFCQNLGKMQVAGAGGSCFLRHYIMQCVQKSIYDSLLDHHPLLYLPTIC